MEGKVKKTEEALTELREKGEAISSVMPLQVKLSELEMQLSDLTQKYTVNYPAVLKVKEQIRAIKEQLKNLPKKELLFDRHSRKLKTSEKLSAMLEERYEEARITEAAKTKDVKIVNPAVEPTTPVGPHKGGNLFVSGLIGIILGLVVAMVAESMDTSIGTIEDVEQYLKLPVLGVIPHIKFRDEAFSLWKKSSSVDDKGSYEFIQRLIMQHQSSSLIAEAYKTLQASIKFNGLDKVGNSFVFTSVGSQEGKTITITNCALSFAQMGKRVLVVDADLRRPEIHKIFGIERENGLTDLILGTLKLDEAIKTVLDILLGQVKAKEILRTKGMENLSIITSGHLPSNPPGLLNSPEMSSLIEKFKDKFDVVLFDCPPVLPVVDAVVLASKVEGVILVYQVGKVARGVLKRTKVQLENANAKPIGVVLNNIKASEMELVSPYYRRYQQYYGKEKG